jgi:phosphoglycerol transferase
VTRKIAPYAAVALASLLILAWRLHLWQADLAIPLGYFGGDVFAVGMAIKGILAHGWYYANPDVGAPHGLRLYDYPTTDSLNWLMIKVLGGLMPDWAAVLNLFYFLTFPLAALAAFGVLRHFGMRKATAGAMALLYTFLPYHFWRGQGHLFLSAYHFVPVLTWLALRIWDGEPLLSGVRRRTLLMVLLGLAIGSSGLYYAYFGCFFLVVAALSSYWRNRSAKPIMTASVLIAFIAAGVALNLAPTVVYKHVRGPNTEAVVRHADESEVWALKITQLLIPVDLHRVPALADLKDRYNSFPLPNENTAMLGIAGAIGFIWLLARRLRLGDAAWDIVDRLSVLNLGAILLATLGGLGAFLSLFAGTGIRSYNRISVFIAFFALFALGLLLDRLRANLDRGRTGVWGGRAMVGAVLALGLLDQLPPAFTPRYAMAKAAWNNDRDFVREIEASLAPGALVYQLPYMPFPENPAVHDLGDYELFRGYLHGKNLKWSYGAFKGRPPDRWQRNLAEQPLALRIDLAIAAGFQGFYVARRGFADHGAEVERRLGALAGKHAIVSQDGTLAFFDLTAYAADLKNRLTPAEWQALGEPVVSTWAGGFHGLEGSPVPNWRWCSRKGTVEVANFSDRPRQIRLAMRLAAGVDAPARVTIAGPGFKDVVAVRGEPGVAYERVITLPAGDSVVSFSSDARRVDAPGDTRELVFRVLEPQIRAIAP